MNIYIPSRSRFSNSLTLENIAPAGQPSAWPREKIFMVVPTKQLKEYGPLCKRHGVRALACPASGIALTRQWIGQRAGTKFLMLDDDLRFFIRPQMLPDASANSAAKLFKADTRAQMMMFNEVERSLDKYVHVAISARAGNQNLPWPFELCNRPLRALAYRRKDFLACEHNRVAIMEDFDITLQLIKKGQQNKILTAWAQDQIGTQAAGGCSDYRTHQLHEENVLKMVKLHAPWVVSRLKENKGGGEFGKRTEATIYWKRLWEDVRKQWL